MAYTALLQQGSLINRLLSGFGYEARLQAIHLNLCCCLLAFPEVYEIPLICYLEFGKKMALGIYDGGRENQDLLVSLKPIYYFSHAVGNPRGALILTLNLFNLSATQR